jgi:O-antigen/teichoic acid export membrane protein
VPWILFAVIFRVLPKGFTKVSVDEETKQKMHDQLKRFSAWLSLWSLFSILASRIDQVVISHYLGLEQVAIYAAAYQLIQLYPLVTQSIAAVLSPKISGLHSKTALIHFLKRSLKWISIPVIVLSVLVYPSQYIITLFFGNSFSGALPVYLVLAYSLVFNIFAIPFSLIITAYNRTELMAISGVIQVAVNIVGTIILVPRFGVLGAGYTFGLGIVSAVLYNIACSVYLLKNKEIVVN